LVVAEENEETLQTTAELVTDGTVKGRSKTTASGPFSVTLRQIAAGIEAGGRGQMAATQLRKLGSAGTGTYDFEPPRDDLIRSYTVTGFFQLEQRPELLDGKAFALLTGLRLLVQPGEFLLGSWTLPKAEPTPCLSGHQVEELFLTLPPGRNINSLPGGKIVDDHAIPFAEAREPRSFNGGDGQEYTPPLLLFGECSKIPLEANHNFLAVLVMLAYCMSEPGETPGATLPANCSQ
jgi:hypothetical protein